MKVSGRVTGGLGAAGPAGKAKKVNKGGKTSSAPATPVLLEGDLVVARAPEVRDALLGASARRGRIKLAFGDITRLDLSLLQILCALHRSANKSGKELALSWEDLPAQVRKAARLAGFCRTQGCLPGCLWVERT
jgi:anti-anti-sigma regulatory factor